MNPSLFSRSSFSLVAALLSLPLAVRADEAAERLAKLQEAAEKGDAEAQFQVGRSYFWAPSEKRNDALAAEWFRKAAEQGHAKAQNNLGYMYSEGRGVKPDKQEAAKWLSQAAEQGTSAIQDDLGVMFSNGQGVPRDLAQAEKWFRKAAEQGLTEAFWHLGELSYFGGDGVKPNYVEAEKWLTKAASTGKVAARNLLGVIKEQGYVRPRDLEAAAKEFEIGAKAGNPKAQANLGRLYYTGQGVPRDLARAWQWLTLACDEGDAGAKKYLRDLSDTFSLEDVAAGQQLVEAFRTGSPAPTVNPGSRIGVSPQPQDLSAVAQELIAKAEQGDVPAQQNLGRMYYLGLGVEKDVAKAWQWLSLAAGQGDPTARSFLGEIKSSVPADLAAKGEELANAVRQRQPKK